MTHDHGKTCRTCPHATATGAGLAEAEPRAVAAIGFAAIAPILQREFLGHPAASEHERPPAIGPPIPA
jgi:hypothetical protein